MKLRWKSTSDEFKGFLDHGTSVTGELVFSGTLRIDGNVHGSIATSDVLIVGDQASIHADVRVGEIEIYGSVFGNVEGTRRVHIYPTGRLRGDVRTPRLVIEDGGVLAGRSSGTADQASEDDAVALAPSRSDQTAPPLEAAQEAESGR